MTTRTYPDISPSTAERFFKQAVSQGWKSTPPTVDFSYSCDFAIIGYGIDLMVEYDFSAQTVTVTVIKHPLLVLSDEWVLDEIQLALAAAEMGMPMSHQAVWGNERGQCRPYFKLGDVTVRAFAAGGIHTRPLTIQENCSAYDFPQPPPKSSTVGIIELGGGYTEVILRKARPDLPVRVKAIPVGEGLNSPGDSADVEVELDIQVIGVANSSAKCSVYFAENTSQDFAAAIAQAVKDKVCCISISWGGPEDSWSKAGIDAMEAALLQAKVAKIPVFVAAGDNLSTDGDSTNSVDYPASSPNVIACGGTRLSITSSDLIASEVVWNNGENGGGTGGGLSALFAEPQAKGLTYRETGEKESMPLIVRGVPDVCGNADPVSGYMITLADGDYPIGGTSAVAPLWAALYSMLIGYGMTPVDDFAALLYQHPEVCRDVTAGNNGVVSAGEVRGYAAGPGYDLCTGLGSPIGGAIRKLVGV